MGALGCIPRSGIAGVWGCTTDIPQDTKLSKAAVLIYIPPSSGGEFHCSQSPPALVDRVEACNIHRVNMVMTLWGHTRLSRGYLEPEPLLNLLSLWNQGLENKIR